jgi:hypothetical protein
MAQPLVSSFLSSSSSLAAASLGSGSDLGPGVRRHPRALGAADCTAALQAIKQAAGQAGWQRLSRTKAASAQYAVLPRRLPVEGLPMAHDTLKVYRFRGTGKASQGSVPWTESQRDFGPVVGFLALGTPWVLELNGLPGDTKRLFVDMKPGTLVVLDGRAREQGEWSVPGKHRVTRPRQQWVRRDGFDFYLVLLLTRRTDLHLPA